MLTLDNVCVNYDKHPILQKVSVSIAPGKITTIIGPNGSGKSTLLKSIAHLIYPTTGNIHLSGQNLKDLSRSTLAKKIAFMSQTPGCVDNMTVEELVMLGRYPHQKRWRIAYRQEHAFVQEVIEQVGLGAYCQRPLLSLSGGQLQRAWMAMALAQDTPYLLLDEPTTYLDLSYQLDLLNLIRTLNHTHGKTIIMVLHDLNHAIQYSDELIVLHQKMIFTQGQPQAVISEDLLTAVFKLKARILPGIVKDLPYIVAEGTCLR